MHRFRTLLLSLAAVPAIAVANVPHRPTLLVTIVVDQYSANLFDEYRATYTGGLARLAGGVVFPSGYQSHANTETCAGHSTILTGARPARTGIIANEWIDAKRARPEGTGQTFSWYCVRDVNGQGQLTVTPRTLLVPTLGERLRAADPNSRTVAIGGKDRAAVMLAGHDAHLTLWWERGSGFVTYPDATIDPAMRRKIGAVNERVEASYGSVQRTRLPKACRGRSSPVPLGDKVVVGEMHDTPPRSRRWRATPAMDRFTLEMAEAAIDTLQLGKRQSVDVLAISFSATDYVGHYYGTAGPEMCAQQFALDQIIKRLLSHLDKTGVSYVVALTADHGGLDIPERNSKRGVPQAERLEASLSPAAVGDAVAAELNLPRPVLLGEYFMNDVYLSADIPESARPAVLEAVRGQYASHKQVAKVFSKDELLAADYPSGPPDQWTLLDRAKASFNPERSGDLLVMLAPYVTLYETPDDADEDYAASHGLPWDYDRRVPILFWWPGIVGYEQSAAVETVDIAPTLAELAGLKVQPGDMDGRVLPVWAAGGANGRRAVNP